MGNKRIIGALENQKTEISASAIVMSWMRQIIEDKQIDLGLPDVETVSTDRKRPDLILYESRRSNHAALVIEFKLPDYDIFDAQDLKDIARAKATKRNARYFAITNFRSLVWFHTEYVNQLKPEEEQIVAKIDLSDIKRINEIEQTYHSSSIKKKLEEFLLKFYSVYHGKEHEPKLAVDEYLVLRIQERINSLTQNYKPIIMEQYQNDSVNFRMKLEYWFADQGWLFEGSDNDFEKAARQTSYLLVNKILFYNLLQAKRPKDLDPLDVPVGLTKGQALQRNLQIYYDQVLKIDYATIYTTDFMDEIAFPDVKEIVSEIIRLIKIFQRFNFSTLGYEVVGRIFEELIPVNERRNLGQYFTNSDVVDVILHFSSKHEDDIVLDPSCGAGTFLVRAYQHKKLFNPYKRHEEILNLLWGYDIARFPAHLATINLAISDLSVNENYPNILHDDFFTAGMKNGYFYPQKWIKARAKTLNIQDSDVKFPQLFDIIVGNPPYTRQEDINKIFPQKAQYKNKLISEALQGSDGITLAQISKRAGIYTYFFVQGFKFLKEGGRLGFIVSTSWLDSDYGKGLQEFILNHFKISCLIESKVERWFHQAEVNTCIIILEKCSLKEERDSNLVRFVCLKKPLNQLVSPARNIWEKQVERRQDLMRLSKSIYGNTDSYENENLRIIIKPQQNLIVDGTEKKKSQSKTYIGDKWGKYLRAPASYFSLWDKVQHNFVKIADIGHVRRGYTTNANDFFYLTDKIIDYWNIEQEFWTHRDCNGDLVPNYIIKSPRESDSILVRPEQLKHKLLIINKDKSELSGTNILRYIEDAERRGYSYRTSLKNKSRWYEVLHREPGTILWSMAHDKKMRAFFNPMKAYVDHNLFEIIPNTEEHSEILAAQLNSTLYGLIRELYGRSNLGGGSLKNEGIDICRFPVIHPQKISSKNRQRLISAFQNFAHSRMSESLLTELRVSDDLTSFTIENIMPERRMLDKVILEDILGMNEREQLALYSSVIDILATRTLRARSVGIAINQ